MYDVEEAFPGVRCETTLWWTRSAAEEILRYVTAKGKNERKFLGKLEYWAKAGFKRFEGKSNCPIKHEEGEAFRIGDGGLFRIAGFYEDETKKSFIAISAFLKHGQKNSARERQHYKDVSAVKETFTWQKKGVGNEQYPRIAEDAP